MTRHLTSLSLTLLGDWLQIDVIHCQSEADFDEGWVWATRDNTSEQGYIPLAYLKGADSETVGLCINCGRITQFAAPKGDLKVPCCTIECQEAWEKSGSSEEPFAGPEESFTDLSEMSLGAPKEARSRLSFHSDEEDHQGAVTVLSHFHAKVTGFFRPKPPPFKVRLDIVPMPSVQVPKSLWHEANKSLPDFERNLAALTTAQVTYQEKLFEFKSTIDAHTLNMTTLAMVFPFPTRC